MAVNNYFTRSTIMARLKATPVAKSDLYLRESVRLKGRISPRKLLIELNKVYRAGGQMFLYGPFATLGLAFIWDETPQRFPFWNLVNGN